MKFELVLDAVGMILCLAKFVSQPAKTVIVIASIDTTVIIHQGLISNDNGGATPNAARAAIMVPSSENSAADIASDMFGFFF